MALPVQQPSTEELFTGSQPRASEVSRALADQGKPLRTIIWDISGGSLAYRQW